MNQVAQHFYGVEPGASARAPHDLDSVGSVAGAARILHVTTSAVSQQIARLQRDTGQQLTERQGRGIGLTETGTLLARNAGGLLTHVERVETRAGGCACWR